MTKVKNSILLKTVIEALYNVASRRTSSKFADEAVGSTIKTLEGKFEFMKYIDISKPEDSTEGFAISISSDIETVRPEIIGKAIEALIRIVYSDIGSEAGLYFITELKEHAGDEITRMILNCEVDLDQVQLEQHYAYRRKERKNNIATAAREGRLDKRRPENLIGYTWSNVSRWKHDPGSKYCTLYDKEGKVLDRLNIDRIIQNYVEKLSGYVDVDIREIEQEVRLYEKEYELLHLLLERDMDAEVAMHKLKISREELNNMIRKLSQMEMLQYVDFETVELTDTGIGFLSKKGKTKK